MAVPSVGRRAGLAWIGVAAVLVVTAIAIAQSGAGDEVAVVFDGQSLNRAPERGYPDLLMEGRGIRWAVVAVNGRSWLELALDQETRLYPHADDGETTILIMSGGRPTRRPPVRRAST